MDKESGGFGLFGFLCFVALVAVIFGINMHEAFWGIMGVGAVLLVIGLIFYWIVSYGERHPAQPQIAEAQIVRPRPVVQSKPKSAKSSGNVLFWVLMIPALFFVSATIAQWLFGLVLNIVPYDFYGDSWLVLLWALCLGVLAILITVTAIIRNKRRNKKRTNRKR